MITTKEIEALGFILDDKWTNNEQWIYEFDNCVLVVWFRGSLMKADVLIYELGYKGNIELKGEVTIERIKKLIKALQ